ncbi:MAG: hypothetical protein WB760_15730 [Xanthobacteraceae bacterium]
MARYSDDVRNIFAKFRQDELCANLEAHHDELVTRRIDFIEYGDPEKLQSKERCKLNCQLLAQALLHRADCLVIAAGAMVAAKNVYGLALIARGYVEAVAVLGYFCKRVDALTKGNIDFNRFEKDVANGLLGAKHDLFSKADAPVNIITCVEQADKYLDVNLFEEKRAILQDVYGWLSEFAHPNFCSNKSAFTLDKVTGRMILRHEGDLQESDFQLLGHMHVSALMFSKLFDDFKKLYEVSLAA